MCPDSWLVCMYGGDRVLVPTPTLIALAVRGRSVNGHADLESIVSRHNAYTFRMLY